MLIHFSRILQATLTRNKKKASPPPCNQPALRQPLKACQHANRSLTVNHFSWIQ